MYKNFKENYIKQVADEYYFKGLIPKRLYEAMYKYEVEINGQKKVFAAKEYSMGIYMYFVEE